MATKVKNAKRNLPIKEADLNSIASDVAKSWQKHPQVTLLWTNYDELKKAVDTFSSSYTEREEAKGSRMSVTQALKDINAEINIAVELVKSYIADIYSKKNAPAYYVMFGIEKSGKKYSLPIDNDKRLYALDTLINGIESNGFADRKYGKAYWTDVRTRFAKIKLQASETDKTSAEHVSIKTTQKILIRRILNSLILSIRANYPDTWKEELRIWGFQKEKY